MRIPKIRHLSRALAIIFGSLLAVTIGLACLRFSFGEPFARSSYDLPFLLRSNLDTREAVLVYLDDDSAKQLQQPLDNLWNRALHVPLLDRLTRITRGWFFTTSSLISQQRNPGSMQLLRSPFDATGK